MLTKLAFMNIWRYRRRVFFTQLSIIFGVCTIIFAGAFNKGTKEGWAWDYITSTTGAFQVEHQNYEKLSNSDPLMASVNDPNRVKILFNQYRSIIGVAEVLRFSAIFSTGEKTRMLHGMAVNNDELISALPKSKDRFERGRAPVAGTAEIAIATTIANEMKIDLGQSVMLLVHILQGGLDLREFKIVGFIKQELNVEASFEIPLLLGQQLNHVHNGVSQLIVGIDRYGSIKSIETQVKSDLRKSFAHLKVVDHSKLIPNYTETSVVFDSISFIIGAVLFIMVGGGISNILYMSVMERRTEVGTMMAIGAERKTIRRLFIIEGAALGLIGGIIGISISVLLIFGTKLLGGIVLPPPPGYTQSVSIIPIFDLNSFLFGPLLALAVSTVASLIPAAASAGLDPVEALREK